MVIFRCTFLFLLFGFALANAQSDCHSLAKTELEKVFCKISVTPEGRGLPSFSDFRRNNAQVQALLLKRPAERLGISLPNSSRSSTRSSSKPSYQAKTPRPLPANSDQSKKVVKEVEKKPPSENKVAPALSPSEQLVTQSGISGCEFKGDRITCGQLHWALTHNLQNHQLEPGVLGSNNVLNLPAFNGQLSNKSAVNRYLAQSYKTYIDKMILIGLAGSTMTYTKFHYTFWELVEKQESFANRVGTMYEFIKKDKASMAVKTRYGNDLPGGIDWCADLSDAVIVCDNGKKNWVYIRQS